MEQLLEKPVLLSETELAEIVKFFSEYVTNEYREIIKRVNEKYSQYQLGMLRDKIQYIEKISFEGEYLNNDLGKLFSGGTKKPASKKFNINDKIMKLGDNAEYVKEFMDENRREIYYMNTFCEIYEKDANKFIFWYKLSKSIFESLEKNMRNSWKEIYPRLPYYFNFDFIDLGERVTKAKNKWNSVMSLHDDSGIKFIFNVNILISIDYTLTGEKAYNNPVLPKLTQIKMIDESEINSEMKKLVSYNGNRNIGGSGNGFLTGALVTAATGNVGFGMMAGGFGGRC
jgi:hypothetical protein